MRTTRLGLVAAAFVLTLLFGNPARAANQSTRGPFYIQGIVLGFAVDDPGNAWFHQDVEFGYHTTGRHDGFVIGVRQGFDFGNCVVGETVARLGYDIAIPLGSKAEMTIAPYGVVGVNYLFPCGGGRFGAGSMEAGLRFGGGIELKFFVYKGFYILARPAETTGEEFVDFGRVYFHFDSGAGVGVAF